MTIVTTACTDNNPLEVEGCYLIRPEQVPHQPEDTENPGVHDRNRVQEAAYRRGSNHGARQPPVQGYKGCFNTETCKEKDEGKAGKYRSNGCNTRVTARDKIKGISYTDERHDAGKDGYTAALRIDQVFPSCCKRLRSFLVDHERIGGDGKDFVKDKQGEHVGRERDAHHRPDRDSKRCIIPRLGVLHKSPHIPDVVYRCYDPEERGEGGKKETERICSEPDIKPGKDLEWICREMLRGKC